MASLRQANTRTAIGFLNVGHALDHLAMAIFPIAVLAIARELGRDFSDVLPLSLGGFIAFGAGSLPAGWLGDRWSRHGMMIAFFCGLGLALVLTGLARTPFEIAAALTLVGLCAAIYHPVGLALLVIDQKTLGRTLGVNGVAGNLGIAAAVLLAGKLIDLSGWRTAFIAPGVATFLVGLAYWRLVPDPGPVARRAGKAAPPLPRDMLVRVFLVLAVATLAGGVIFSACTNAMPKLFDERLRALTDTTFGIGALVAAVYALAAVAQLCVGQLIQRFPLKSIFLPVALMQAPLLYLAGSAENWAMLAAAVAMMFFVFGQIPINDAMVARYAANEWRSRVFALRYVVSFGASALAVPLVAVLHRNGGFRELFVVLAAVALCTLAAAFLLPGPASERAAAALAQPAGGDD